MKNIGIIFPDDLAVNNKTLQHLSPEDMLLIYENVREPKQWTLDRIDNSIGHNTENVVISCLSCNLKRRTMDDKKFKFIVISPVLNTGRKIGIGWHNFKKLADKSNTPVFALGGMNYKRDIKKAKNFGGIGIASISYFYNLF